jgi:lysophospholipase L1-like esterase
MKRMIFKQFVLLVICTLAASTMIFGKSSIAERKDTVMLHDISDKNDSVLSGNNKGNDMVKNVTIERLLSKLAQGQQVTIVALGDSNTELTFHTRGHLNWVYLLQESLYEKYGPNMTMMIDAGCSGENAAGGLKRLNRDVLRFSPDLVIICYWDGNMKDLREIITKLRSAGVPEILLRTPNPVIATNQPAVNPPVVAGKEWPDSNIKEVAKNIVALANELQVPVVDHYTSWMQADVSHEGSPVTNPNKLWLRMSDSLHPGTQGHIAFYRDLAPFFGLPSKLSWEF